jgi:hypothetical protein
MLLMKNNNRNFKSGKGKMKKIMKLEPGFPVLREAVTAIYRAAFGRLKRNFAFFSAV